MSYAECLNALGSRLVLFYMDSLVLPIKNVKYTNMQMILTRSVLIVVQKQLKNR